MKIGVKKPEDCPWRDDRDLSEVICRLRADTLPELRCHDCRKFPDACPLVKDGPILIELEA